MNEHDILDRARMAGGKGQDNLAKLGSPDRIWVTLAIGLIATTAVTFVAGFVAGVVLLWKFTLRY